MGDDATTGPCSNPRLVYGYHKYVMRLCEYMGMWRFYWYKSIRRLYEYESMWRIFYLLEVCGVFVWVYEYVTLVLVYEYVTWDIVSMV